ncbi:MAG: TonB family protein [Bacteroidota bacterium]
MRSETPVNDPFDDYLEQIRQRESVRHRRILSLGVMLAGLFAIGLVFYFWPNLLTRQSKWRAFQYEELTQQDVHQLFQQEPQGFLVSHPMLGWDTVRSDDDFRRLSELVDLIEKARQPEAEVAVVSWVEDSVIRTETADLEIFVLDVEGERQVDQELIFTIENYDPKIKYTIDFGNGVKRKMRKRTRYTYPLSGNYTIQLLASSEDRGSSLYAKSMAVESSLPSNRPKTFASADQPGSTTRPDARKRLDYDLPSFNEPSNLAIPRSQTDAEKDQAEIVEIIDLGQQVELTSVEPTPEPIDLSKPLVYADVMPEFPGGLAAMNRWLTHRLRYPSRAKEKMIEGRVVVQFVVNTNGNISELKVLKGIGGGCDEEALRVISEMPAWIPGELNGQAAPVYKAIPIIFQLM